MKKVYLASAMMGAAMILAAPAQAVDSTGCGLGSMAWRGQRGIGPQVLVRRPTVLSVHRLSVLLSVRPAAILTAA